MKTKKLRRMMAILLSLIMCLSMVPQMAFAEKGAKAPEADATLDGFGAFATGVSIMPDVIPLTPDFDPATNNYVLNLGMIYSEVYFLCVAKEEGQTITAKVDGTPLDVVEDSDSFRTKQINITKDTTTVEITVTSKDGNHTNTYTVIIKRVYQTSAKLKAITACAIDPTMSFPDNVVLTPTFDPAINNYVLSVPKKYNQVYFYLSKKSYGQTITAKVDGKPLSVHDNGYGGTTNNIYLTKERLELEITVTSEDGNSINIYSVVIKHEDVEYEVKVENGKATVDGIEVITVRPNTQVTITADKAPPGKVFDKWVVVSGGISLDDKDDKVTKFTMLAKHVSVKATYRTDPLRDVTLKSITANVKNSTGDWETPEFTPKFDSETKSYELNLTTEYDTAYFSCRKNAGGQTVTAKVDGKKIDMNYADGGFKTKQFYFYKSKTPVEFTVTSADGSTTNTYTVVIKREGGTEYAVDVVNDGNGTASASPMTGTTGTEVTLTAKPNSGYRFKKWQVISGGVTVTGNKFTIGTENVKIKAIFEKGNHTVSIVSPILHGSVTADKMSGLSEGDLVTLTVTPDTGYVLESLIVKDDGANTVPMETENTFKMPASNVSVDATFKEVPASPVNYTVTFDSNGGSAVEAQTVNKNEKAKEPIAPTKENATFVEWQLDGVKYDFDKPVTKDITLKAVWKDKPVVPVIPETSTITIDPSGGKWSDGTNAPKTYEIEVGKNFTLPASPTRDGYTFKYWKGSEYKPGDIYKVTSENHTFTAIWQKKVEPVNPMDNSVKPKTEEQNNKTSDAMQSNVQKAFTQTKVPKTGESSYISFNWIVVLLLGFGLSAGITVKGKTNK